ncbi:MAG: hypothetical protein HY365_04005 [Candidatus Aenigmarchaeota archaeon]|nr:hypothetical protein [Candidatus Aenigmarchaeota archaeon]
MTTDYSPLAKVLVTKEGMTALLSGMFNTPGQQQAQYEGGFEGEFKRMLGQNKGTFELGYSPRTGKEYYVFGNDVWERTYTGLEAGKRFPHHRKIRLDEMPLDVTTPEEDIARERREREFDEFAPYLLAAMGVPAEIVSKWRVTG